MSTYETYRGNPIVIKPKSTNFGLGITIFNQDYSRGYGKAFEIAFTHDQTVLLEEFMTGKEYRFLVMGDQVVGSCIVFLQMSSVTVFTRSNSLFMRRIKTHFEVKGIRLP